MVIDAVSKLNRQSTQVTHECLDELAQFFASSGVEPKNAIQQSCAEIIVVPVPDLSSPIDENVDSPPGLSTLDRTNLPLAEIRGDLSETTGDWMDDQTTAKKERAATKNALTAVGGVKKQISAVADDIMVRFPLSAPRIVCFLGIENDTQVHHLNALVARELAQRHPGRVLLIDSAKKKASASKLSRLPINHTSNTGLSDHLNGVAEWNDLVSASDIAELDFLPAGSAELRDWQLAANRAQLWCDAVRRQYQFTCISHQDACHETARMWATLCDGAYLVLSLTDASRTISRSAARELTAAGVRLLGCILVGGEVR
jgi:hypothetical protein